MEQNKKVTISINTQGRSDETEGIFLAGVIVVQDYGKNGSRGKMFMVGGGTQENAIAVVTMLDQIKAEIMENYKIDDSCLSKDALTVFSLTEPSADDELGGLGTIPDKRNVN